jgi:hypothetical protein
MTAITSDEIKPGIVVFIDQALLAAQPGVIHSKELTDASSRPLVCVAATSGSTEWLALTTEYRPERLEIRPEWRTGGHPQWLRDPQFVNDGASVWMGPHEAFVASSILEITVRATRARVSREGLDEIRSEMEEQRHRRER